MRRTVTVLTVIAFAPLLMGGGGPNPPTPGLKITGPAISAIIVIDPHNSSTTPTAGLASIRLDKGSLFSGATFLIPNPVTFPFSLGCTLIVTTDTTLPNAVFLPAGTDLTAFRFVNTSEINRRLLDWIPSPIITALFAGLGITADGSSTPVPVITDIDSATCTTDTGPGIPTPSDGSPEGILSFKAVIQFQVPQ